MPSSSSRPLYVLFALMLAATLWFTTRGWHANILDRHEFRQLQTAVTTYWIKEAGYKFDYETPLFGPPWSIPMEFPVYQLIVARTSQLLGTGIESTARAVSLFFLFATLPAVAGFAGLFGLDRPRRFLVAGAVLASPTYLFYGRAFMIETTALCGAAWFVLGVARAVRDVSWRWSLVATVAALGAALAKVTTFLIFCPPAALVAWWMWRRVPATAPRWKAPALAALPVASALTLGWLWVQHSDVLKRANPYAGFLTSKELTKWNWGTLEQRLSGRFWEEFWSNVSNFVLGEAALLVLLVGLALAPRPLRRAALWCVGFFLFGVLLFSNLFFYHDYYYCANALILLTGAGFLLVAIWDDARLPHLARYALVLGFLGGQLLVYHRGYADYARRELPEPPGLAEIIRRTVPAEDVVLIYGWEWNSVVPYYAQRRAIMVPGGHEDKVDELDSLVRQLGSRRVVALLVRNPALRSSPTFIRARTDKFRLATAPIASSPDDGDLYLAQDLLPTAVPKLFGQTFARTELHIETPTPTTEILPLVPSDVLDQPIFSPRPQEGRARFGMSVNSIDNQPVLNAHAPSELTFAAPAGARTLHAEWGLPDGAFAPGSNVTDGIELEIVEHQPGGLSRTLYFRHIDPARVPADRGRQVVDLTDAGPFHGTIVFRIGPGPKNNLSNDWAYWGRIEFR